MDQSGAYGSVIFRNGALSLDISGEVTLENNKSLSSGSTLGFGGAIYSGGNLVISGEGAHLILSGNVASSSGKTAYGGAIYSGTTVSIIATQWLNIQGNHATGGNVLGGAIYSGGVVTIIAKSIDVTGNKATASGNAQGGAIYASGSIALSADSIIFSGNSVSSSSGTALGGAIYSAKGDITLSGGSILFEAQSGGVYAASGGISVLAGELSAAAGVNFSAPKGTFSMADGTALTVNGVASSADATADKLFSVTAPYIAFGDPEEEASSVVLMVDGEAEKDLYFLIYSGSIITSGKENYGFDLRKYEKATVRNSAVEGGSALVLSYSNPEETYTWLGTSGGAGVWDYDDANTSVWENGKAFKIGGTVYFEDTAGDRTVNVSSASGDVNPSSVTIGADNYLFRGLKGSIGAISGANADKNVSLITLKNNVTSLSLENITVADSLSNAASGGALVWNGLEKLSVGVSGDVTFKNNRAEDSGGAIALSRGSLSMAGTGNLSFTGNTAEGDSETAGGAIWVSGDVALSADSILFSGNSVYSPAGKALGGAIYSSTSSVSLASTNAVTFSSAGDDVYAAKGNISIDKGSLSAAAGVNFAAPQGSFSMAAGTTLSLNAAANAATTDELFSVTAASIDFGGATLILNGLSAGSADFLAYNGSVSGDTSSNYGVNLSNYRTGTTVTSSKLGRTDYTKLTLNPSVLSLLWTGASGDVWETGTGKAEGLWQNMSGGTSEDFYAGDTVTFGATLASQDVDVNVVGSVNPAAVTLEGSYNFTGTGSVVTGTLDVTGGTSTFGVEVTADKLNLTGGAAEFMKAVTATATTLKGGTLTLDGTLTTGLFWARTGSTLVIDGIQAQTSVPLQGSTADAMLIIDSAASLYLKNASIGTTYKVAKDFDSEDVWTKVDGDAGSGAAYTLAWDSGTLNLTVSGTPTPVEEKFKFLSTGSAALNESRRFGDTLQSHALGMAGRPGDPLALAQGFMPLAPGKTSGVWADAWYHHSTVDGLKVGGATQDTKTKTYGVTIGSDHQLESGGVIGLALNLGKSEADGRGSWDGYNADGKFISLSVYGAKNLGAVTLAGDLGYNWFEHDHDSTVSGEAYRARGVKSSVTTIGATAYWNLKQNSAVAIRPFLGLRWSHYSQDSYIATHGSESLSMDSDSASQWTIPLGVRFDWTRHQTQSGWTLSPNAEVAYVRAAGDTDVKLRQGVGAGGKEYLTALTDENSFRASLGLEAKRNNLTLGMNFRGQFSSNQRDLGLSATARWDF